MNGIAGIGLIAQALGFRFRISGLQVVATGEVKTTRAFVAPLKFISAPHSDLAHRRRLGAAGEIARGKLRHPAVPHRVQIAAEVTVRRFVQPVPVRGIPN